MSLAPLLHELVLEIERKFEIGADGSRRAIKGDSVAGNVLAAFADCRMSKESIKAGDYDGPKSIRFNKLVISGE